MLVREQRRIFPNIARPLLIKCQGFPAVKENGNRRSGRIGDATLVQFILIFAIALDDAVALVAEHEHVGVRPILTIPGFVVVADHRQRAGAGSPF